MAERPRPDAGFHLSILLVVLTLGLIGGTSVCVLVAGIALGLGPAALITAILEGELAARGPALAGVLLGPFAAVWLLHRSWIAFARARAGRCADYMIAALVVALGLHALVFGAPLP
jgi:hypothetical protein